MIKFAAAFLFLSSAIFAAEPELDSKISHSDNGNWAQIISINGSPVASVLFTASTASELINLGLKNEGAVPVAGAHQLSVGTGDGQRCIIIFYLGDIYCGGFERVAWGKAYQRIGSDDFQALMKGLGYQ